MKTVNRLILVRPKSLFGLLICTVTRSPFSHAAVEVDGVVYDASERRATFGKSLDDYVERERVQFTFYADLDPWLRQMHGVEYDWKGVVGWLFGSNDLKRFYCFEAAWEALRVAQLAKVGGWDRLTGDDLHRACMQAGLQREVMPAGVFTVVGG